MSAIDARMSDGKTASVGTCGYTSASYASSISVTYWYAPGPDDSIQKMINLAATATRASGLPATRLAGSDDQHVQIHLASSGHFLDIFATMGGDASDVLTTLAGKAVGRMS